MKDTLSKSILDKNKHIALSLFGHLCLFSLIIFNYSHEYGIKKSTHRLLPTYIHVAQINSPQQKIISSQKEFSRKTISTKGKIKHPTTSSHLTQSSTKNHLKPENGVASNNKTEQKILTILHKAIAEKQSYPENAQELNQSGTVRIQFLLYPDGRLAHFSILQSSGFTSIDSAALAATKAISPIKQAGTYLQKETFFSIDIIFE
jgi:TonB family protein